MACRFFNNNGYGCAGCRNFIRTNSVMVVGTVLVLNIPQQTFFNKQRACICAAQAIPATVTPNMTVAITIGASATQYALLTKCGNNVHADQIRSRKVYNTHAVTDRGVFAMNDDCTLCCTSFNFPVIPATAAVVSA